MSILREVSRGETISGLRIKRRCGDKIKITHKGETLTLQIVAFFSGFQVLIAFDSNDNFIIGRDEYTPKESTT